jgi:hypothetical protein
MITILSALVSLVSFRVRSRASLELELIALRHQVIVLRRQRPRRLRLFLTDRLFWVWLYRMRPQLLDTLVLVKPATVIGWHRKGFRLHWRWRSRRSGRSKINAEIRDSWRSMLRPDPDRGMRGANQSRAGCGRSDAFQTPGFNTMRTADCITSLRSSEVEQVHGARHFGSPTWPPR